MILAKITFYDRFEKPITSTWAQGWRPEQIRQAARAALGTIPNAAFYKLEE